MTKRPDENDADMEAGMTTAERRRRRRRGGGLRVPSDNVPRGTTVPPVVAPVPEDPNLAVSIAYSFGSDASGPRAVTDEMPGVEARPDTLTGDGPEVGDAGIIAPEAQATVVDGDGDGDGGDGSFEVKTREMTAVDLEALGLEDPERRSRRSGEIVVSPDAVGAIDTIVVDDELATTLVVPPKPAAAAAAPPTPAARATGQITAPSPQGSSPGLPSSAPPSTIPPPAPPPRGKPPTPAPPIAAAAAGVPFGTVPAPRARADSPDPRTTFGEDERSVEIDIEEPSRPGADQPVRTRAPDSRVGRAQTVSLSDDDLEELLDGRVQSTIRTGETVALTDTDLEDLGERAPTPRVDRPARKDESGEIVVDVVEEIDSGDIAAPVPSPRPHTPSGPVATPAPARGPTSSPPPLAAAAPPLAVGISGPPPLAAPAAGPVVAKGDGPPAPPPPPKAPPPAPVTAKKPVSAAAAAAAAKTPTDRRAKRGKPWFEEIFDEDYLRTLPFLTPQATQAEAQFVIDALAVQPGAQLLDLGCGYGRHAMELAARGFHLVGLDLSLPLLLRGADEAQRRGLSINFVHADMRELDFDAQFDGVYCLFSTFGYFDDETNKKAAAAIARALKPGARCVLEVLNRDYLIDELPTRVWWEGDGCVVLEEVEFNYFSSRIHSNRSVVFDDGRQIEQEISIRAYSLHELGKLLHSAGFRVVEVSGSIHTRGRYFGNHSRHIIVVVEKKPRDAADPK